MATRQPLHLASDAGSNHQPATAGPFRLKWPDSVLLERPSSAPAISINNKLTSLKRSMTVLPNRTMFVQPKPEISSLSKSVQTFFHSKAQSLPVINGAFPKSKPFSLSVTGLIDILPSKDRAAVWPNSPGKSPVPASPTSARKEAMTICEGQNFSDKSDSEIPGVIEACKVVQEATHRYEVSTLRAIASKVVEALPAATPRLDITKPDSAPSPMTASLAMPDTTNESDVDPAHQSGSPNNTVSCQEVTVTPRYHVSPLRTLALNIVQTLPNHNSLGQFQTSDRVATDIKCAPSESPKVSESSQDVTTTPRYEVSRLSALALKVVKTLPKPTPYVDVSLASAKKDFEKTATGNYGETTVSPSASESSQDVPTAPRYEVSTLRAIALKVVDTLPKPTFSVDSLSAPETKDDKKTSIVDATDTDSETAVSPSASEYSHDVSTSPRYEVSRLSALALKVVDKLPKQTSYVDSLATIVKKDDGNVKEETSTVDANDSDSETAVSPSASKDGTATPRYEVSILRAIALTVVDTLPKPKPFGDVIGASADTKDLKEMVVKTEHSTDIVTSPSLTSSKCSHAMEASPIYEVSTLRALASDIVKTLPKPASSVDHFSAALPATNDSAFDKPYSGEKVNEESSTQWRVSTLQALAADVVKSIPKPASSVDNIRKTGVHDTSAAKELDGQARNFNVEIRFVDSIEAECRKNNEREVVRYRKILEEAKHAREEAAGKLMIVNHRVLVDKQTYLASEQESLRAQILHLDAEIAVLEEVLNSKESVPTSRTSRQPKPPKIEPRMTRTALRLQREKGLMVKAELAKERLLKLKFDQIRKEMEAKHLKIKSLSNPKSIFNVPKKEKHDLSEADKKQDTLIRPVHDAGIQKPAQQQSPFKKAIVRTCPITDRVIKASPLPAFYKKASALHPIFTKKSCLGPPTRDQTEASHSKKAAPMSPIVSSAKLASSVSLWSARNFPAGDLVKGAGGDTRHVADNRQRNKKSTGNDACAAISEQPAKTMCCSKKRILPSIKSHDLRTADGRVKSHDQPTAECRVKSYAQRTAESRVKLHDQRAAEGLVKSQDQRPSESRVKSQGQRTADGRVKSHYQRTAEGQAQTRDQRTTECQSHDQRTAEPRVKSQDQRTADCRVKTRDQRTVKGRVKSHDQRTAEGRVKAHDQQTAEERVKSHDPRTAEEAVKSQDRRTSESSVKAHEQRPAEGRVNAHDMRTADGLMKVRLKKNRMRTFPIRDRVTKANPLPAFYKKTSSLPPIYIKTNGLNPLTRDQTVASTNKMAAPLPPIARSVRNVPSGDLVKGDGCNTRAIADDKQQRRTDHVSELTTSLHGPTTLAWGKQKVLPHIHSHTAMDGTTGSTNRTDKVSRCLYTYDAK
ncbi:uncharacterized protein LOC127873144 isoform X3 [Dreissena polymorpha]|uniref:uncharacterized protein LOC127873144 isoform X3 n=1 Tax=Dreissena polymorpha TaxID=45954 RepID=UPI00226407B0|nr:uncharacterized protein LOC127873144 isoform X3 [Dreissena polymorpha]